MAFALRLVEHGLTPERLEVGATVTLADVDGRPTVTTSQLDVVARVPDVTDDAFQSIVAEAAALCPISRLFAGAAIAVHAELDRG
jgi:osmotically inducible protein OsmC